MAADRHQLSVEVKGLAMNILDAVDLYRFYHIGDSETLALRGVNLPDRTRRNGRGDGAIG